MHVVLVVVDIGDIGRSDPSVIGSYRRAIVGSSRVSKRMGLQKRLEDVSCGSESRGFW